MSEHSIGEGFAFARWLIGRYREHICQVGRGGWKCFWCRHDWQTVSNF